MSATQLAKRALVVLLLAFARVYHLDLKLNRDSADTDVKKGFRRVIVKAHPDKPGGSGLHPESNYIILKVSRAENLSRLIQKCC